MQAAIDSAIPPPAAAPGRGRIPQVDYLKGILITLMVLFHLSWFSTHYLDVTRYVYVFHMSGFIILSGFFANTGKTPGQFLKTWLGILAPYLVFESLYYLALSHLPASVPASNRAGPGVPRLLEGAAAGPRRNVLVPLPAGRVPARLLRRLPHSSPVPSGPAGRMRRPPGRRLLVQSGVPNNSRRLLSPGGFLPDDRAPHPEMLLPHPVGGLSPPPRSASFSPSPPGTACWGSASACSRSAFW